MPTEMYVTKRNGEHESVSFDKILKRIKNLGCEEPVLDNVNYTDVAMKVIEQLYEGIKTTEIDELTSQQCASLTTVHYDYGVLASKIVVSNHQKTTKDLFGDVMDDLYNFTDVHNKHFPIVSKEFHTFIIYIFLHDHFFTII